VRRAEERHQVVLALRPDLDVLDQDHLVVAEVEGGAEHLVRLLPHAAGGLGVRPGDPGGGVTQTVALRVLADGVEQLADRRLDPLVVELAH
jgi:hypothetical protein